MPYFIPLNVLFGPFELGRDRGDFSGSETGDYMANLTQRLDDSWVKNSSISTPPAPGARDFFRAILTRRRSPGPIPRLRFHPHVSRRPSEHGPGRFSDQMLVTSKKNSEITFARKSSSRSLGVQGPREHLRIDVWSSGKVRFSGHLPSVLFGISSILSQKSYNRVTFLTYLGDNFVIFRAPTIGTFWNIYYFVSKVL